MEKVVGTRNGSLRSPGERSEPILVAILVVSKVNVKNIILNRKLQNNNI